VEVVETRRAVRFEKREAIAARSGPNSQVSTDKPRRPSDDPGYHRVAALLALSRTGA